MSPGPTGKNPTLAAVDLGAESCRVALLRWAEGSPEMQIVHRFPNSATQESGGLRWNIRRICEGVEEGLRACAKLAPEGIAAVGVDGWAVDYVRLSGEGQPIADPFCYRDERNAKAMKQVHAKISADRLYELTGGQVLALNTLYQLYADGVQGLDQSIPWVNLPEFILYWLGGRRVSEFTNATHTQLLGVRERSWSAEIFEAAGLEVAAAPPVVQPGTDLGAVTGRLSSLPSFARTRLIAPACHDTASAIAGISAQGDDWAFVSSGTWSLIGTVLDSPETSNAARRKNFSNEGGVGSKIYFLKNVNGMWLLRQCLEHWQSHGQNWTFESVIEACAALPPPEVTLDVDDPNLLLPGDMPGRINAQLVAAGKRPLADEADASPAFARLIFHGLASRYADVLRDLAAITGKSFKRLFIVGGGAKNALLNRLTANATGLEIVLGSTESTTVGNFAIQLAALAGQSSPGHGVTSSAVSEWAGILSDASIGAPAKPVLVQ